MHTIKKRPFSKSLNPNATITRMLREYPHLRILFLSYICAIVLFFFLGPEFFHSLVAPLGIGGIFIVGMMYSYSFTLSLGALLLPAFLDQYSPAVIAIFGGLGGTFADMTMFQMVKNNLKQEMKALAKTNFMKAVSKLPLMKFDWFRDILGAILIASPLPDEIGIAVMASAHLSENAFRLIALIANVIGIYLLVTAAAAIY
jgi:hypothetical protein